MSCHNFFRNSLWLFLFMIAMTAFSMGAHSAEWPACEKAKLRQLKLQSHSEGQKTAKRSKRRNESHRQSVEEIDTWLWKNCREFSYELRQLEQDKM